MACEALYFIRCPNGYRRETGNCCNYSLCVFGWWVFGLSIFFLIMCALAAARRRRMQAQMMYYNQMAAQQQPQAIMVTTTSYPQQQQPNVVYGAGYGQQQYGQP